MGIRKYPIDPGLVPMFTGRAPTLPRTRGVQLPFTEATADANTFVCEFTGGSSANETGVGLGLTGADLVFTQVGSVPASSGGYRTLDGASQYFTGTASFAAAFLNQSEWTYALKYKSFTQGFISNMFLFSLTGKSMSAANFAYGITIKSGTNASSLTNWQFPVYASAGWIVAWRKNGIMHLGVSPSASLPTGWDSFSQDSRVCFPSAAFGDTFTTICPVGAASYMPAMSVGVVVASKYGLASAPV